MNKIQIGSGVLCGSLSVLVGIKGLFDKMLEFRGVEISGVTAQAVGMVFFASGAALIINEIKAARK